MLWLRCFNCYTQTLMNASIPTLAWGIPSVKTQKAAMIAFAKLDLKKARPENASVSIPLCSLRASSPVWASEASLSRTREHVSSAPRPLRTLFAWKNAQKKIIVPVLQASSQVLRNHLGAGRGGGGTLRRYVVQHCVGMWSDAVWCQPSCHGV